MSGGFFRGTSADQDTRFSNKQAKLLKTQKFPPELDHLVDMRKVQIEVIKPWIASRVTELLGFEDEVLINFIFGLLDAKEVDGKQIQIQLTGFMEKNTPKFMRELWGLLLSAQQNASGVPQQFLDAKAEEIIKKKAESDRIVQEIQRKREKEANEQQLLDQQKKKDQKPITQFTDDKRGGESKHASESRERKPRKSGFDDHSPAARKSPGSRSISPSRRNGRETSRSFSPKRSSRSPALNRSTSPVRRRYRSPRRSPPRRRSPYYSRRRSPSPSRRRRSPPHARRRSPEPVLRRSTSPARRRRQPPSPVNRRQPPLSPSPRPPSSPRRSSPQRKRSYSPDRSSSPSYNRSTRIVSRSNRDGYKNSRGQERSPNEHTNGRAKRKGPESIAVRLLSEKAMGGSESSPENSPPTTAHLNLKSPRNSAYREHSPVHIRHRRGMEVPVRPVGKQTSRHDSSEESIEEERPTRTKGREVARRHPQCPSVSPEERRHNTKQKPKDAFTPDDGKQSFRGSYHSNGKGYESEEEMKYGPDPDPMIVKDSNDDDLEKHQRSYEREKKRHKATTSRKHRKYSDESSGSETSEDSERRRRRREEKRRMKRQRCEEKQRGKHRNAAATISDGDVREGSEEGGEAERQKRLEIELKERALQSFRAKKSASSTR